MVLVFCMAWGFADFVTWFFGEERWRLAVFKSRFCFTRRMTVIC